MQQLSKKQIFGILAVYFIGYDYLIQIVISTYCARHFGIAGLLGSYAAGFAVVIAAIFAIAGKWLREQFRMFMSHPVKNLILAVITFISLFAVSVLVRVLVIIPLGLASAGNQVNNDAMMQTAMLFSIGHSILFAPFVEEVVYRGCMLTPFAKKHFLFGVILSACAFGGMHCVADILNGDLQNLPYFALYASLGLVLALPYRKSRTIFTGMTAHMLFNLTATVLTLI